MIRYCIAILCILFLTIHTFSYGDDYWRQSKWNNTLTGNSSLFRIGYGGFGIIRMQDSNLSGNYKDGYLVMADMFFYRYRHGRRFEHGLDLYTRYTFRSFSSEKDIESESGDIYKNGEINTISVDVGARYLVGKIFLYELWQIYLLAAPRWVSFREEARNDVGEYVGKSYYAVGFVGGIGFEVTLFPYMGLFVEYNNGYTPVGDSNANIEGHQILFGVTARTPLK
jgi:hypothetical protein